MAIGFGFPKIKPPITPPIIKPTAKYKLQISFFQSCLNNEILPGKQAAQMCRSEEEIPKRLLPIQSNKGAVSPITGPAIYQGQGLYSNSIDNKKTKSKTKSGFINSLTLVNIC